MLVLGRGCILIIAGILGHVMPADVDIGLILMGKSVFD